MTISLTVLPRSMRIKQLRRPTNGKNKKNFAKGMLITFGNGSVMREVEAVAAGTEEAMSTRDGQRETRGLLHLDTVAHGEPNTAVLHLGVKLIHISRVDVSCDGQTADDFVPRPFEDPFPAPCHGLEHLLGGKDVVKTNGPGHGDIDTLPADLQHQYAEELVGIEGEDIEDVVIERDPLNRQKPLAHVPLEETGEDVLLPFHLVALPHHLGRETFGEGVHHFLFQGHVLVH